MHLRKKTLVLVPLLRKHIFKLPRHPNNIASLAFNHDGLLLAVASSYTYQEAKERFMRAPKEIRFFKVMKNSKFGMRWSYKCVMIYYKLLVLINLQKAITC
ncbi:unnamed protein product, partial [Cuscuta europaea]